MSSIAAHVWTYMFVSTFGIRMPKWMGELADDTCKDHDDLAMMLSEFSSICPSAMSSSNFTDTLKGELTELHAELRVRAADGSLPALDLYSDRPSLILDSRTRTDPTVSGTRYPADMCVNPVLIAEVWNALVVYIDAGAPAELAVATLDAFAAVSGIKLFVVCARDDDLRDLRACIADHQVLRDTNIPMYSTGGMDAKTFTTLFPKVSVTFVCVTTAENVSNNAFPDACTRFTYRNILIVPDAAELTPPSIAAGYGRLLDASRSHSCCRPEAEGKTATKYALSTRVPYFKDGLQLHLRFDGSEVAKSMLAFYDALVRGQDAVMSGLSTDSSEDRFAVMAIESRASASLVSNILRTAWATGATRVVVVLCSRDKSIHDFYRKHLGVGRLQVHLVELPPREPFMRASPFSMNAYNAMMTSPQFWEIVSDALPAGDHVLCVQDDGCIVRRVPQDRMDAWLDYDYIGAPWHPSNLAHLRELVPGLVGNGGVSLRRVSAMIECAKDPGDIRDRLFDDRYDMPEDVFFAHHLERKNKIVASTDVARVFSMEQVREDGAYGVHKPWLYHPLSVVQAIMDAANLELGLVSPQSSWTVSG